MFGKKHLDNNAHTHACNRAANNMQQIADDEHLSELQRQLARQARDIIEALHRNIQESNHG